MGANINIASHPRLSSRVVQWKAPLKTLSHFGKARAGLYEGDKRTTHAALQAAFNFAPTPDNHLI